MENIYAIQDTYELIELIERIKVPAKYLTEIFFPRSQVTTQEIISLEYKQGHRLLAPFVSKGAKGVEATRPSTQIRYYKTPLIGVRRTISMEEISRRLPGETPIFSTKTPQERAAEMQANDLVELMRMIENRKSAMASELLQTGQITVSGYGDDGRLVDSEVIDFKWDGALQKDWSASNADIYGDLKEASETIQEKTGIIPTIMICGRNVEKKMISNKNFREFLFSANPNALAWMNFKPQYTSPQVRMLGYVGALNLEIISYNETYLEDGEVKSFVDPDNVIIGIPSRGRMAYGAISYLNQGGQWQTAAAEAVPIYNYDTNAQMTSLTVFSRALPIPESTDDFICMTVAQ